MTNFTYFLVLVDGSPVSVRRYKAIFEQDRMSAERAREPGTHFEYFCKHFQIKGPRQIKNGKVGLEG